MVGANVAARRAHGGRRRRRARPPGRRCRRPTRSTRSSAPSGCSTSSSLVATLLLGIVRGALRQQRPDVHAGDRRRRATSSGPTAGCTRPSSSPTSSSARRSPACCWPSGSPCRSSFDAGDVRRLGRRSCSPSPPRRGRRRRTRRPSAGRGGRRWPRASAGCGTTTCCARWPSRSALLNLLGSVSGGRRSCCAARRCSARRRPSSPSSRRRAAIGGVRRRLAGVGASPSASAPGRRSALTLWGGGAVLDRHRASCRPGRSPPCCCSSTIFTAVLWNVITVSLRQTIIPDRLLGRVNSVYRFFGWGAIPIGGLIGGVHRRRARRAARRGRAALRVPWIVAGRRPARARRRRRPHGSRRRASTRPAPPAAAPDAGCGRPGAPASLEHCPTWPRPGCW